MMTKVRQPKILDRMTIPSHEFIFTSESVSEGHPDKIADQISDAVLDALISQDQHAHVACETLVKTGMIFVAGEITTNAWADLEEIARHVVTEIGYTNSEMGLDGKSCAVIASIGKQSSDITRGINKENPEEQGAGDQGMMFGYASNETEVLMPAPITYAHRLMRKTAQLRKSGDIPWLLPDGKCQISLHYTNHVPDAVTNIVFSTQHREDITQSIIEETVIEEIIKPTIPSEWLKETNFLINPTGRFVIGGPQSDCGLTGRKIIVDTYGGFARHGGGCFSGKDPSKVDRTGAYMARYIAKNLVAAGICDRCEVQISYAIGVAQPTALHIETFGTEKIPSEKILTLVNKHFDLRPYKIIEKLKLLRPIYQPIARYGHFGRDDLKLTWEETDLADTLKQDALSLRR